MKLVKAGMALAACLAITALSDVAHGQRTLVEPVDRATEQQKHEADKAAGERAKGATNSLLSALKNYNSAPQATSSSEEALRSSALERQSYFQAVITRNPGAVLAGSLSEQQKKRLPAVVRPLLENKVTFTGTLEHYHHDYFSPDGTAIHPRMVHEYYLQPDQGQRIPVYFPDDGPKSTVQGFYIEGLEIEGKVAVSSYSSPKTGAAKYVVQPDLTVKKVQTSAPTAGASARSPASRLSTDSGASAGMVQLHKIAVILYNFVDRNTRPITPNDARAMVFTGTGDTLQTGSVNAFFKESTYGKIQFTGALRPDGDVFGWYTLNHPSTHPNNGGDWIYDDAYVPLLQTMAQADGFDINNYDVVVYIPAYNDASGVWHGNKIIFSSGGQRSYWPVIAHELGHALKLGHSHSLQCVNANRQSVPVSNTCLYTEYGDFFDIMSAWAGFGHHNAWEKLTLGPLRSPNVINVTSSGTYTLNPLESSAGGTQVLKIPAGKLHYDNGYNMYYYVEFHANTGWDRGFVLPNFAGGGSWSSFPAPNGGVLIKFAADPGLPWGPFVIQTNIPLVNPAPPDNIQYYPLPAGKTFVDADAHISIRTVNTTANNATVAITVVRPPPASCIGDSKADIAFVRPGSDWSSVPVLFSNGDGSWRGTNFVAPSWANQPGVVAVPGDYDGDGKTDIAFVRPGSDWSSVPVLFSNGDGSWRETNFVAPSWANQPGVVAVPGDYDGDGKLDIAFVRPGGGWSSVPVLFSNGNGSWRATNFVAPSWTSQPGVKAIAGDYNHDGKTDIAFVRPGSDWNSVPVLFSNGDGSWRGTNYVAAPWANQPGTVAIAADYNFDGKTDIAFVRPGSDWNSVPVLFSNGDGSWNATNYVAAPWANEQGVIAVSGDFNRDGRCDIAFVRPGSDWSSVPVLFSNGDGSWNTTNYVSPAWANQPGVIALFGGY